MVIMELPFDILDHIFSFLKFHPKALLASSKTHPVLSQIVERYRFRHIIIRTGDSEFTHSFKPSDLRKYIMDTPQISKLVAILQIEFNHPTRMATFYLKEIVLLLSMFPVLECIMLQTRRPWLNFLYKDLPHAFRTAVENCFKLPTMQEVHVGTIPFPISILNNHANINYLSFSGIPIITESLKATYPRIKTLALEGFVYGYSGVFLTWARRRIVGLQSLKYNLTSSEMAFEVFEICSSTLENLYLCFDRLRFHLIDLSSLTHLQHLTMNFGRRNQGSCFSGAAEILKTAPTLQKLTIEIHVDPSMEDLDLSLLRICQDSSLRFPCVDLYMYTGSPRLPVTYTKMHSWLAKHEGLVELVERGMLVVHPEETAPALSRSYVAKEYL